MSAHTPGPWVMCGEDRGGCSCGLVYAKNEDAGIASTYLVEDGFEMSMPDLEARKANARLISAAPDLLADMKDVVERLAGLLPVERIARYKHSIAKATGES